MESLWSRYLIKDKYNTKNKKENYDILIIGAGISGISTAFNLRNSKFNVCLIDESTIASSTTSLTTGKITYLQDCIYSDLEKCYDRAISKKYFNSQIYGKNLILENIKKYNIKCDLEKNDSYIFVSNKEDINKLLKEKELLDSFNITSTLANNIPINISSIKSLKAQDTYVFNPIKYLNKLCDLMKDNIDICENTRALTIDKKNGYYITTTTNGNIKSKYVIVCTQYPFFIIPGLIPFKTHIEKSHVIASKIKDIKKFNAISIGKNTYSIRYYKDKESYIIFAGESYKMSNHINYKERQEELRKKFKSLFNTNIDYEWSTYDLTSNDYLPIIGEVSDNLLIATAFNKWGMINGVLSGKILSDIILEKKNEFKNLFDPKRSITIERIKNFVIDSFNISKIFIRTKINKNKSFYNDRVKIINKNGKSYGIYIDDNNKEHIVRNLCPHMKCSLIFNYMDKTWDCPCHGSRFSIDGEVVKGPSVYDIKIDKFK